MLSCSPFYFGFVKRAGPCCAFFFFLVIGVNNRICFEFFVGGSWQVLGWAGLVSVMAVTIFFFLKF